MGAAHGGETHQVQLFINAERLAGQVVEFVDVALRASGTALVIARRAHLGAIESRLATTEHVHRIDADELLAQLLVDGHIGREQFAVHVGALIERLVAAGPLRVYGELVDLLWAAGNADAMLELESLWDELLGRLPFALLCGYRIDAFDRDPAMLDRVVRAHDIARALQAEIERRQRLETLSTHLLDVTAELAQAGTHAEIARIMIERAGTPLGTSAVVLWTLAPDASTLELLDATEPDRAAAEKYRFMPLDADTPVATAVRTGETIHLGSLDEYAARFPASRARIEQIRAASHVAFAIVPFIVGDIKRGGICFTYPRERTFDEAERTYQTLLARHCALALSRVYWLEQERDQRAAVEQLYELIASFNRLDEIDDVYNLALQSVIGVSRSDRAAILLVDQAGVMRFRASSGLSARYRAAVEGHSPWAADAALPAPIVVGDTETDPGWASYRAVFEAEGIRALAFVPIVHQRRLIGTFMLYRNAPRSFVPRDLQLTATVAVHVAQAVERKQHEQELARAYREERDAHHAAEDAARAREEILSVVSHDLRNPLGTIMIGASALLHAETAKRPDRVHVTAERIHRGAERMARLIEGLVDFAAIQAGRLELERRCHAPYDILSTTREIYGPIASERGLKLETEVVLNLPPVECDSQRAVQVLSNLVSNALKVTPKGGQIAIGASLMRQSDGSAGTPRHGDIVFFVRDTGPGIEPEELPTLFERTWRGKHSVYRGTGLGLSIARSIVDAHGGRIWVESRLGAGSTFFFSLAGPADN